MGNSPTWEGYEQRLLTDTRMKAYAVPDSAVEGASTIYRHPNAANGLVGYLQDEKEDLDTGWKLIEATLRKHPARPAYGWRMFLTPMEDPGNRGEYEYMAFEEAIAIMIGIGHGLRTLGLEAQENVGIYSSNRPEWILTHYGNWTQSYRTVALYDTLGAEAVAYIISHADLKVIVCEKNKLVHLFAAVEDNRDELQLQYVIQIDYHERYNNQHEKIADEDRQRAEQLGLTLIGLSELLEKGAADEAAELHPPTPDDLAFIMYTSGTTGNPKGVMLSHSNFSSVVSAALRALTVGGEFPDENNMHVSYLPLAHSFETVIQMCLISIGACCSFFQGDIRKIGADWQSVRPTMLFGVPRIFVKTYDKVLLKVAGGGMLKKTLFDRATASSVEYIRQDGQRSTIWDTLVWKKVAAQIGFDNVRLLLSGAAPIAPHVAEFLRVVCSEGVVMQGYGMTETCAASVVSTADDFLLGHVGIPVDNVEIRLVDAPECEYYVTDKPCARGEVQMRGPAIMVGYFKNEEATAKMISDDGWLSTGDIGRINPNGTLSIIDRRKNMFKTAQGEYIAAEKIEIVYSAAQSVGQIWLYGNSFKPFVVAVVVPDAMWLKAQLDEQGLWPEDANALTPGTQPFADRWTEIALEHLDFVKERTFENITQLQTTLKSFEKVRDILVEVRIDSLLQGFNIDTNTLTPSFKLKRPQLKQKYKEQLKDLYAANGEAPRDDENW